MIKKEHSMINELKPIKEILKQLDKVSRKQLKKAIKATDKQFKKERKKKC